MSRRILRNFVPDALKKRRESLGMSRPDLARFADVSVTAIADWEKGRRTPGIDTLVQVAKALKCEITDLVDVPDGVRSLADLRILAGLTQPQLGRVTNISTTAIGALERAEVRLTDERAAVLAEALGVDAEAVRAGYDKARNRGIGESP
ncbi:MULTISPECIES: helix-turn-helix transcriptional regulator [Rhodococcus]|uniref:Transcriptional regulator n=1 Tax=Rhodococcus qingshengii TaxID=334542 RepID=A0A2A5J388_RHOSG|nr:MULTISPECIES: helix-turn-helix transcriptional regulator [Rhodococcus]MBW4818179.1 helix-turn-helix domain-containing protein [Rhodococcus qingshengii]MCJ0906034.1 helix-turn-helix domain-containing protein [Rhodococcus sp. ARC_M6]MDN3460558.1 helix-turn-helix transcriptional regulator [Rhodococcus sp. APC 3903]PCK24074.1 transcriptional regulator [Rhodococcus qingshengii]